MFAHNSERQFAELLDFYGIEWSYEPTTFVLARNELGEVTEAFTPDFYLPRFDRYVEITTTRQKYITRKNAKVRRLREAYPEVDLMVLCQRDYQNLLTKYGFEDTSGTQGNLTCAGRS
ncbi:MAG: hypothetical protein F4138_04750 [Acidimicrobiia bacterium]|nr:hypothetical protein [Acidimicrobiia bacterium]MYC58530.1 hypothetical protein [Acidimicrobiia bacterium]MYG94288.1 hypothetical protein [Acidimicrobiia bacterium]MYI30363.1 hypothetical protein [Acidimicrobiia bacterium]